MKSAALHALTLLLLSGPIARGAGPFDEVVAERRAALHAPSADTRRRAAEALGFLRARAAAPDLVGALADTNAEVRRDAALALGWCGARSELAPLAVALDDTEWSVRQAASVALEGLTGLSLPFDALAPTAKRNEQASAWRDLLQRAPATGAPPDVLRMIDDVLPTETDLAASRPVTASSTYKGPASVVTGEEPALFWQTKNVALPQHCTIELEHTTNVGCVIVEQYGPKFCLTNCAIEVSADGTIFREVWRQTARTEPLLTARFEPVPARFVRIVSRGSENPAYPTTFYRVRIFEHAPTAAGVEARVHSIERALHGLGTFAGPDASGTIQGALMILRRVPIDPERKRLAFRAGLRSLGRIGDELAVTTLSNVFEDAYWARYAADALGECGTDAQAAMLAAAYPQYARDLAGKDPRIVPPDDRPGVRSGFDGLRVRGCIGVADGRTVGDAPLGEARGGGDRRLELPPVSAGTQIEDDDDGGRPGASSVELLGLEAPPARRLPPVDDGERITGLVVADAREFEAAADDPGDLAGPSRPVDLPEGQPYGNRAGKHQDALTGPGGAPHADEPEGVGERHAGDLEGVVAAPESAQLD